MPLPDRDFDVTEVAVPWHILTESGHRLIFATERAGTIAAPDPRLLNGVVFGKLGAKSEPLALYAQMIRSAEFTRTLAWEDLVPAEYDGLILPGETRTVAAITRSLYKSKSDNKRLQLLTDALVTLGRVPLAFYIAHVYLIHTLTILLGMAQGFAAQQFFTHYRYFPKGFGVGLAGVYLIWITVVVLLYPFCRWVAAVKARRQDWWLSYV